MAFKIKSKPKRKLHFFKEFGKGFAEGIDKAWDCCQFNSDFKYKSGNGVKIRMFDNEKDALKFVKKIVKSGVKRKNIFHNKEVIFFSGIVCNGFKEYLQNSCKRDSNQYAKHP